MIIIGSIFIVVGLFFMVVSTIGMFKFNTDKIMKVHAIGVNDALGMPLVLLGVLLQSFSYLFALKIIILILLLWITSTTSGYVASRIIYHDH
jgi:multicomponent Na+:H+ antiporter subunit G